MTTRLSLSAVPIRRRGYAALIACGLALLTAPAAHADSSGGAGAPVGSAPASAQAPATAPAPPQAHRPGRRAHRASRSNRRAPRPARRPSTAGTPLQQVQRILGVTADGQWGSRTLQALQRWQSAHGLPATGVTDVATVRSLGLDPSSDPPLPPLTAPAPDAITGPSAAVAAELAKIAQCESGGDIHQLSTHGTYRGKYQFDMESWFRAGGLVDPAQAPEAEQDQRAAWILATQGRSAWPNCS